MTMLKDLAAEAPDLANSCPTRDRAANQTVSWVAVEHRSRSSMPTRGGNAHLP
jgi:hypothetical protein